MAYDAEVRVNTEVNLDEFKKLNNEVDRLEKKFETLKQRGDINEELGVKATSKQMRRLDIDTENTYNALTKAKVALAQFKAQHGLENVSYQDYVKSLKDVGESAEKAERHVSKFGKRVWGLAKRIFVFSLIAKAFRAMLNGMKEGLQNFAQFSSEYNGVMSEFKSQTEQLKNSMATAFAPIIMQIIPWLTKLVSWLNIAMDYISQFFAVLQGKNVYAKAKKQAVDYAKALGGVNKEANKLANFDDINILDLDEGSGGSGALTGADAFEWAEVDTSKMEWVEWLKDNLDTILTIAKAIGIAILGWMIASKFFGVLSPITIGIALLCAGIYLVVKALQDWIDKGYLTDKSLMMLLAGIMLIGGAIALFTGSWIPLLIAALVGLAVLIATRGEEIKAWLDELKGKVFEVLNNVQTWVREKLGVLGQPIIALIDLIKAKINLFTGFLKGGITQWQGLLKGFVQIIKGIINGDWAQVWEGAKTIFKGFVNGVIGMLEAMINRIVDGINSIGIDIPEWVPEIGGMGFHPHIPHASLPRLATGGIVNRPTTALIGENGREAVMPLENNTEWMNTLADRINNNNQPIVIKFEGSLSQLAQVLKPALDKENSRVGTSLIVAR